MKFLAVFLVMLCPAFSALAETFASGYGLGIELKVPFGKSKEDSDLIVSLTNQNAFLSEINTLNSNQLTQNSKLYSWGYSVKSSSNNGFYRLGLSNNEGGESSGSSGGKTVLVVLGVVVGGALPYNYTANDDSDVKCGSWQPSPGGGASRDCH